MTPYAELLQSGFAPVPINPHTKRPPVKGDNGYSHGCSWKRFQTEPPTTKEVALWDAEYPHSWGGVVCGRGSGNLEVLDFDVPDKSATFYEPDPDGPGHWRDFWAMLIDVAPDLADRLCVVETPSGGRHIPYRCPEIAGNTKIACRDDGAVLVETRGQGGLVVVPPSPGYTWIKGSAEDVPMLESSERRILWDIGKLLDLRSIPEPARDDSEPGQTTGRPGDDFDADPANKASDILLSNKWKDTERRYNGSRLLKRPGDTDSLWSAVECGPGDRYVHVFTSNAAPFEPGKTYGPFRALVFAGYGGDYRRAAAYLRQQGYGGPDLPDPDAPEGELPEIAIGRSLPDMALDAIDALRAKSGVYVRQGRMVRVVRDEFGGHSIREYDESSMRGALARSAHWVKFVADGKDDAGEKQWRKQPVAPPLEVVKDVLSMDCSGQGFPNVLAVSVSPVFVGTRVVEKYGLDPETGWFVGSDLKLPRMTVAEAVDVLNDWVVDFPFDSPASKANFLALPLTMLSRPSFDTAAGFLNDASTPATGKTLLGRIGAAAVIGRDPSVRVLPRNEEELEKLLSATILGSLPELMLDNVDRRVSSPALSAVLTSSWYGCRQFGTLTTHSAPVRTTFILTANNLDMSRDVARRMVLIRLDAHMERPEDRTGFRHADIMGWTLANRARILGAYASIYEAWVSAGCPQTANRKGGYEQWSSTVPQVLAFAGWSEALGNEHELRARAGQEDDEWAALYEAWEERFDGQPVKPKELLEVVDLLDILGRTLGDGNDKSKATRFGIALNRRVGRICGGRCVERSTMQKGCSRFNLTKVVDVGGPSTTPREEVFEMFTDDMQYARPSEGGTTSTNVQRPPPDPDPPDDDDEEGWVTL